MLQVLAPGVQDGDTADLGAEVPRIGTDRAQHLGRDLEQGAVDGGLVLQGDRGDRGRQVEHDVEVLDRQQFGLAVGQPLASGVTLTLGTMPVAAGVVGDPAVAAGPAALTVPAQGRGPADTYGAVDTALVAAEVLVICGSPRGRRTEDVGDLEG